MYIVFEWTVGTGKTTQSKMFVSWIQTHYPDKPVLWTREPGWSQIADDIRTIVQATPYTEDMDPVCEAYLYASSRAQTLRSLVDPLLSQWGIVVSDRSFCSSIAYQWVWLGLWFDTIMDINRVAIQWHIPDLIFYIDLDPALWLSRTFDQAWDKHESKSVDFFQQVREGYHRLGQQNILKNKRHMIDGNRAIADIHDDICQTIKPLLMI